MLAQLLPIRTLTGGLLNHLSSDPPASVLRVLQLLAQRVMQHAAQHASQQHNTGGSGLPAALCAEPFGDMALQQLAELAASSDGCAVAKAEEDGKVAVGDLGELVSEHDAVHAVGIVLLTGGGTVCSKVLHVFNTVCMVAAMGRKLISWFGSL